MKLAFILAVTCSTVFGNTIVIPNANTSTVGNQQDVLAGAGDGRSQELLGSGQFASVGGSLLIDQLSFRTAPGTGALDFTVTTLNLFLSTSSRTPNTSGTLMSATFADNVGPDNTLVYSGPVAFHTVACAGPAVCPFDLSILFTTPFLYNPSQGRLLLDFKLTGLAATGGTFDAVSFNGPGGGSVASVNGGLNDATGGFEFSGDIVQLRYTVVSPEPASWALMLTGAAALAWMRRRRKASVLR